MWLCGFKKEHPVLYPIYNLKVSNHGKTTSVKVTAISFFPSQLRLCFPRRGTAEGGGWQHLRAYWRCRCAGWWSGWPHAAVWRRAVHNRWVLFTGLSVCVTPDASTSPCPNTPSMLVQTLPLYTSASVNIPNYVFPSPKWFVSPQPHSDMLFSRPVQTFPLDKVFLLY